MTDAGAPAWGARDMTGPLREVLVHRPDAAFGAAPHVIHYALKANSALAVVRLVRSLGSAVDANSMGEVEVALRCGFAGRDIVFTGVGKRADELDRAVALDLAAINVESPGELDRLARLAADRGTVTRVATESFGGMSDEGGTAQIEIRASWTPLPSHDGPLDMATHVEAWGELMCTAVGLPPVPEGVTPMPSRRGQRGPGH